MTERALSGMALPISLCMIVRNESRFLADCLRSAAPYVSEIIIVDTGSIDQTAAIGSAFGAKVLTTAWRDDFAAARNDSLAAAREPWILVLDADERLAEAASEAWAALLGDSSRLGYYVRLHSWVGDGSGTAGLSVVTDAVCRLFRNDERIRFRGVIHEEVASSIAEIGGEAAIGYADGIEIWHEGYRDEVLAERDKFARNRHLLSLALLRDPDNPLLRYAAGTELFTAGRYGEALTWLEPLAADALSGGFGYGSDLLLKIVHACRAVDRLDDAVRHADAGAAAFGDFPDMHLAKGEALLERDDAEAALGCAASAAAIGVGVPFCYSTAAGAGTYRACCLGGAALERLGRFDEAARAYASALAHRPDYEPAWQRLLLLGLLHAPLREYWRQPAVWLREAGRGRPVAGCDAHLQGELTALLGDLCSPEEREASLPLCGEGFAVRVLRPVLRSVWLVRQGDAAESQYAWGGRRRVAAPGLAAGLAAALGGGSWRAAADGFAAVAALAGARPWERRAAAAGLAAAFAAQARAAYGEAGQTLLPELRIEAALPLVVGTAVFAP